MLETPTAPALKLPRFTDREDRTWDVDINVTTIDRVLKRLGINLLELVLPESKLNERLADPILLVNVLYVLCKEQCDQRNVSDEQFGRSLSRDAIEDGWEAVLEGVVNFSPRGIRPAYQKVLEKARIFRTAQETRVRETVRSAEFDRMLEQAMEKLNEVPGKSPTDSSNTAGNSAASLESTPDDLPFEN